MFKVKNPYHFNRGRGQILLESVGFHSYLPLVPLFSCHSTLQVAYFTTTSSHASFAYRRLPFAVQMGKVLPVLVNASIRPARVKEGSSSPSWGRAQLHQTWFVPIWKCTKSNRSSLCPRLLNSTGKYPTEQAANSSDFSKPLRPETALEQWLPMQTGGPVMLAAWHITFTQTYSPVLPPSIWETDRRCPNSLYHYNPCLCELTKPLVTV